MTFIVLHLIYLEVYFDTYMGSSNIVSMLLLISYNYGVQCYSKNKW
jgi:hypothetical protein